MTTLQISLTTHTATAQNSAARNLAPQVLAFLKIAVGATLCICFPFFCIRPAGRA